MLLFRKSTRLKGISIVPLFNIALLSSNTGAAAGRLVVVVEQTTTGGVYRWFNTRGACVTMMDSVKGVWREYRATTTWLCGQPKADLHI